MSLFLRCDRCNRELSGLDAVHLLRHDSRTARSLTTLNRTALDLLDGGENTILCEDCMNGFIDFMENVEDSAIS